MNLSKIFIFFIALLYLLFVSFEIAGVYVPAFYFNCSIVPVIAISYFLFVKKRNLLFVLFMVFYAVADFTGMITDYVLYEYFPKDEGNNVFYYQLDYYVLTAMYIFSYLFLLIKILESLSFAYFIRNLKIHFLVLTILNVYLIYVLLLIVDGYEYLMKYEYWFELVYDIVMLTVLSAALLNYFYKDNKKSLYLFLGSLAMVFSEVMDVAFLYVTEQSALNILSTTLMMIAFYFFYQQTKLRNATNHFVFE